jgi:hypothetical protein
MVMRQRSRAATISFTAVGGLVFTLASDDKTPLFANRSVDFVLRLSVRSPRDLRSAAATGSPTPVEAETCAVPPMTVSGFTMTRRRGQRKGRLTVCNMP